MRSLAATILLGAVLAGCTTGPAMPSASPEAAPTAGAATATPAEPARCRDAAPAITATAEPAIDDPARVPGRALFWDAGKLRLLEKGSLRELDAPFVVRDWSSKLAPDGRVVALLGGERPGDAHLWERTPDGSQRLVKMPVALADDAVVTWSPNLQRVRWGRWAGAELWVVGLDGNSYRASFESEGVYAGAWRTDDELTFFTAPQRVQNEAASWPVAGATLWSWRPPADPVRADGPVTLSTVPRWSPDGHNLATIEVTPAGRAVVLRGETSQTLLTERDLDTGPGGCVRHVEFAGLKWSPDGQTLAVLGRGIGYFAAFIEIGSSAPATIFASPAACYIPGRVEWSGTAAVVPLFGPDCGPSAAGTENALAVVDPKSGALIRYVLISRKGFLAISGGWAVAAAGTDDRGTEFIPLGSGAPRVQVPLWRLVDYCCAP